MSDDDLLREASDPATPGERLREIHSYPSFGDELPDAIAGNPNLPIDLLRDELIGDLREAAWRNPTVPMLLLSEPLPEFKTEARRALGHTGFTCNFQIPATSCSLEEALTTVASDRHAPVQVKSFARHLAGLFGLPWPEEAT